MSTMFSFLATGCHLFPMCRRFLTIRRLQLSDTNGERYWHQIRPVCLQQGPINGIFQQDIDRLVDSLFA